MALPNFLIQFELHERSNKINLKNDRSVKPKVNVCLQAKWNIQNWKLFCLIDMLREKNYNWVIFQFRIQNVKNEVMSVYKLLLIYRDTYLLKCGMIKFKEEIQFSMTDPLLYRVTKHQ